MKKSFSLKAVFSFLLAVIGIQVAAIGHAQPNEKDCSEAQTKFVAAMGVFRSAYFEREDAVGSAESVMEESVLPSAERMYESCPAATSAAIKSGVEKAQASLSAPSREQLVQCDKAIISYKGLLNKFDTVSLSSYEAYRALLYSEIDPSAVFAVDACPQIPDLAQQTRIEITELQRRLDKMQDIDNSGPSYWDTRDNMDEYNSAYEEATD